MACNATSLCVVDLKRQLCSDLSSLDVEKIDVVSSGVYHCPESHGVCDLSMEPNVFIGGEQPGELGTNDTDDIAQHRKENKTSGISENETGTTRRPDREREAIQNVELLVSFLQVPPKNEEEELGAVKEDIECQSPRSEELALKPVFSHGVEQRVRILCEGKTVWPAERKKRG